MNVVARNECRCTQYMSLHAMNVVADNEFR